MLMRNRLLALAVLLSLGGLVALAGCAQSDGANPASSATTADAAPLGHTSIWQALNLTDAQKDQLKALREEHRTEMKQLRERLGDALTPESLRVARQAFRESMQTKLAAILTVDQMNLMKQLQAQRQAKFGERLRGHGPMSAADRTAFRERRMQQLTTALGLSSEQQDQLRAAFEDMKPPAGEHGMGMKAKFQARRAEMDAKLKSILTAEQYENFLGIRAERGARRIGGRSSN